MRTAALLILIALLLPLASAQVPTPPPSCGPLDATVTAPSSVAPSGSGEVTIALSNQGSNPNPAQVTVAASTATLGWRFENAEDQTVNVPAGGSASVTFTILATEDATEDGVLNFAISGTCPLPGGTPCLGTACDAAPLARTAGVTLDRPEGVRIPGLDNFNFPIEYLVAGIALVAIAGALPFLARRKPGGFSAGCPEPLKMVRPGRGTSFPLEVRNPGQEPLTAEFDIGPVPEGWSAFLPLPEIQVAPKETRTLWLMVRAPATAAPGDAADVQVRLRNALRPESTQTLRVRAEANPDAAETPPPT